MFDQILEGVAMALTWKAVGMVAIGIFAGIATGAIPGLTSTMATALLVPFSFFMPPILGLPFLMGLHKGVLFGGAIPAILVNTPGTPAAAATCLDGYPLAQKGEARSAIQMALYSSTLGDTFSDFCLILMAYPLAMVALMFGPAEFFALLVMGLSIIATVTGDSAIKGLLAAVIGVLIGLVGLDEITGAERFTFGILNLEVGIGIVPLFIGLFAVSEVLIQAGRSAAEMSTPPEGAHLKGGRSLPFAEVWRSRRTIFRSALIGTVVGAIPATGATIASFVGYGAAKRASKAPEEFGKGAYEGIAASEAANSAVSGADLIPTITLGIPGSATTAILMGAFIAQGLRPGPMLFQEHAPVIYAIFTLLLLANPIVLLEGWLLTDLFARLVTVRRSILFPSVFFLCIVGSYAWHNDLADVRLALIAGVFAYGLRKLNYPMAPLVIAFIITPIAEKSMKQALLLSHGDALVFLTRPISAFFLVTAAFVIASTYWKWRKKVSLEDFLE